LFTFAWLGNGRLQRLMKGFIKTKVESESGVNKSETHQILDLQEIVIPTTI